VTTSDAHRAIEAVWRIESAKLIAGLTRIVRDVGLAEDLAGTIIRRRTVGADGRRPRPVRNCSPVAAGFAPTVATIALAGAAAVGPGTAGEPGRAIALA